MAISWPIFQAQLRGIIPTNVQQTSGVPDVSELVYKGLKGAGQNIVDARNQAAVEELKRMQLAQQERELAINEEYRRGILGVQQGELAIKQGQQQNWAEMAKAAGALQTPGGATAPAGGPGRGGDASSAGPGLPSFVRAGGAMSNLDTGTRIYNKLVERNIDPKVAAGLVGNMGVESRFNSAALNPNDKGMPSFGLVQHRGDRAARLHGNAAKAGKHWSDEDVQVDTIVQELHGSEAAAYKAALAAGSPAEAAKILAEEYERPSRSALNQTLPERMAVAEAIGRGVPTAGTPGTPPPGALVPPPAAPTRVASLDPSAGLVPPPMGGTPQPAPVGPTGATPPPPVPPPAPPVRQQEQVMPGSPLFPQTPGPAMTMPGSPAAVAAGPPPAPPSAPMPAPTAQAGGVREVVPSQLPPPAIDRNSPQVRNFLAKAMTAGPEAYNAAIKHLDALAPAATGRFTNSERGVFDTHTGRLVAPTAQLDGSGGTFGNSMQAKALEASVARGHITMDQAIEQAGGQVIGAPGGEQRFFTPRALAGAVGGGGGVVAPGTPPPAAGGAPGAPPGLGVQLVPPKTEKADVLPPNAALAVSMGNSFLAEDLPKIKRVVADNPTVLTGAKGRIMYHLGIGAPGEVGRALEKAQESLVRLLTGAAMTESEALKYSKRYGFRPERDTIEDVKKKLNEVEEMIKVGRGAILAGRKIEGRELIGWEEEMKRDEKGFERVSP